MLSKNGGIHSFTKNALFPSSKGSKFVKKHFFNIHLQVTKKLCNFSKYLCKDTSKTKWQLVFWSNYVLKTNITWQKLIQW